MAMRLSGLMSGMDTEGVIQQLVEARSTKVKTAKNSQTKLEWKQEIWKGLNTKLRSLQSKLNDLRFTGGYSKKTTKISDSSVASVLTSGDAVNSIQELEVNQLAKTAYLTGGKVSMKEGTTGEVTALTRMQFLADFSDGKSKTINLEKDDGSTESIELTASTTISDVLNRLKDAGLNASFDATQKRFFVSAKDTGETGNFKFTGDEGALEALGLNVTKTIDNDGTTGDDTGATFVRGQDAKIRLNGAEFTSTNNVFEINGLTITAQSQTEPGKSVTLTTEQDTDGIYDMIKDFLKSYNEVINEMDKLYNADSAKGYEPLSDEERESMSESEAEKYEQKIKDSLLRRDSSLNSVSSAMKRVMMEGVSVDGKQMHLASFGIGTLSYFVAGDNERNAFHIDGDPDDINTSMEDDKLKQMIATDPDTVVQFFSKLTMNLYTEMNNQSSAVEGYRSFGSFYDDKKMKTDYDDYTSKIKDLEKKLAAYEDKWYSKFAAMETAMAKMQNSANAVTGMLGGA